jgi:hypothetical protein
VLRRGVAAVSGRVLVKGSMGNADFVVADRADLGEVGRSEDVRPPQHALM